MKQNAVLRDVLLENEIIAAGCVTHLIKSDSKFYFHFSGSKVTYHPYSTLNFSNLSEIIKILSLFNNWAIVSNGDGHF